MRMTTKKNYIVYFSIYGKKMKTTVLAENEKDAEEQVKKQLRIMSVVVKPKDAFNECVGMMDEMINILNQ